MFVVLFDFLFFCLFDSINYLTNPLYFSFLHISVIFFILLLHINYKYLFLCKTSMFNVTKYIRVIFEILIYISLNLKNLKIFLFRCCLLAATLVSKDLLLSFKVQRIVQNKILQYIPCFAFKYGWIVLVYNPMSWFMKLRKAWHLPN